MTFFTTDRARGAEKCTATYVGNAGFGEADPSLQMRVVRLQASSTAARIAKPHSGMLGAKAARRAPSSN
jgi:hypothetical protein